ncbi:Zinc finger protein ZAT11 [Platanthera zijinensis]|uniref:Zinc finger protein ZAT11 n=1 Tax=Platanthera zijinensis TaxID=2320716 RepID=A0AAP0BK70_9ASPA
MKRFRSFYGEEEEKGVMTESLNLAKLLLLLSRGSGVGGASVAGEVPATTTTRVFECKTCRRQFPSFQALGGHRASHKKPRLGGGPTKPRVHECSVCGLGFAIGQALGGHMRRHQAPAAGVHGKIGAGIDLNLMPPVEAPVEEEIRLRPKLFGFALAPRTVDCLYY